MVTEKTYRTVINFFFNFRNCSFEWNIKNNPKLRRVFTEIRSELLFRKYCKLLIYYNSFSNYILILKTLWKVNIFSKYSR